jgi:hypothetical protein
MVLTGAPMDKFEFKSELWVPQYTGIVVSTLDEFRNTIAVVDEDTLYYHLFRNIFEYHFLIPTYSNSFAYWLSNNGLFILAEKFSIIDPLVYTSISDVRSEMNRICFEAGEDRRKFKEPFYFIRAIRQVVELGIKADNLQSFIEGFESIGIYSLFYHLITARWRLKESTNDFSYWFRTISRPDISEKIDKLNIWMFNLYEIKKFMLDILTEAMSTERY